MSASKMGWRKENVLPLGSCGFIGLPGAGGAVPRRAKWALPRRCVAVPGRSVLQPNQGTMNVFMPYRRDVTLSGLTAVGDERTPGSSFLATLGFGYGIPLGFSRWRYAVGGEARRQGPARVAPPASLREALVARCRRRQAGARPPPTTAIPLLRLRYLFAFEKSDLIKPNDQTTEHSRGT